MTVMYAATLSSTDVWLIVAIFVILLMLAFLSLAEMGLSRITKPKAAAIADRGHKSGKALTQLVDAPERWVNPVLLTINILQTIQAFLTGIVGARFGFVGALVLLALNVIVFFVLAESIPKTYAVLFPERAALLTARPTLALVRFPPLRLVSRGLIGLANWLIPGKGLAQGPFVSEQELLGIVEAAAEDEVIEHEERQLIESIIEFGDTVAREVMVPRPDILFVEADDSVSSALDVGIAHGYSRLPVLGDDEDDVIGVAYTKDLMKAEREGHGMKTVRDVLRPVRFVPENKPVARLMREMQAEKFHLAIVADEYGGVAGLVTLEDCLEELVGDILDEYDTEEADVQRLADGEYLVDGGASVDDLNELLDIRLPDDDWDTVGGFVFGTLGRVPTPGDHVDFAGWRFTAEQVEGRRVRQIRVCVVSDREREPDKEREPGKPPQAPAAANGEG
jgi:CBS domain containing-hemolysin-like protein